MRIYYYNKDDSPVVTTALIIPYGAINDPTKKAGLAHLVEHTVFRGTENYKNAPHFIRKVYEYGGAINAMTSYHSTIYTITLPPRYLNFAIQLLLELVFNTKLNHFNEEKAIVIHENKTIQNDPIKAIIEKINVIIFKNTPYQNSVGGTLSTINNISEKDVKAFYQKYYQISKSNLLIVGKIKLTIGKLSKQIITNLSELSKEKHTKNIDVEIRNIKTEQNNESKKNKANKKTQLKSKTLFKKNKDDNIVLDISKNINKNINKNISKNINKNISKKSENTIRLVVSTFVFSNFDTIQDKIICKILAVILGGNMISRMYNLIREKHQLAYSTESSLGYVKGIAVIYSIIGTNNNQEDIIKVIELMKSIYQDIEENGVTEKEFTVAREYLYGEVKRAEQDSASFAINLWNNYQFFNVFIDSTKYRQVIDSITLVQFNNQIKKIITPNNVLFSIY